MLEVPPIPAELLNRIDHTVPSPEFAAWARAAFIDDPKGPLYNPDHAHLTQATFGVLLTTAEKEGKGHRRLGLCQMGKPTGDPWSSAQREQQIREWFGRTPTFLMTLSATYLSTAKIGQVCCLVEHELYHMGVETDRFGGVKREKGSGRLKFTTVPHDIEEFFGVARRYGAATYDLQTMKEALDAKPLFTVERLGGICGCGAAL